ncbi:MAG: type II toxin-antitoxin system VapC family toxin [Pirellulales bacterium]
MHGEYILDTNVVIALMESDASVLRRIKEPGSAFFSVVVLGELTYGARNSSQVERNLLRIHDLLRGMTLLACDDSTAEQYGIVKAELKRLGKPIPENDIRIAAQCRQYDFTLVTRDAHFTAIDGLRIENW